MEDGPGLAGGQPDRSRPDRQRTLPGRLEEPLGGELRLHRLEAQGEVAEAGRLQRVDVQLVGALLLEDVDPAVDDDLQSGLRLERDARPVVAEDDAAQLRAGVLERQVGVTGSADADLADLALDPDVSQVRRCAQAIADDPGELGDRPDARSGGGAGVVVAVVGAASHPGVPRPVSVGGSVVRCRPGIPKAGVVAQLRSGATARR